jgi:hypothetical protein
MFMRIVGEATSVIKMPNTATKRLTKPTNTSLDKVGVGPLLLAGQAGQAAEAQR